MGIIKLEKHGKEIQPIALYGRIVFDLQSKGATSEKTVRLTSF